jgi:hypothetical protein
MVDFVKICSKCKIIKDIGEFYKNKTKKDGHEGQCKQCWSENNLKYRQLNKDKISKQRTEYRRLNKRKIARSQAKYRKLNKDKLNAYKAKYDIECFNSDINFRLRKNLRRRLRRALRNNYKLASAIRDLGCSVDFLKFHLESQFKNGMSWDNYGKVWHIDHIKALANFDLTNREELIKACHYTNLQPLWAIENIKKGKKNAN